MRKDVKDIIDLCKSVGLEPVMEGGQYKVRDSKTNVLLFNFHQTPSDPNWVWSIRRYLRRLGLLRDGSKAGEKKKVPAIDLDALRIAQEKAEAAGEHIPTLEDLEDSTEFFRRIRSGIAKQTLFSADAQEEAIDIMTIKVDAPRISFIKQRLRKLLEDRRGELEGQGRARAMAAKGHTRGMVSGKGARAEFVRIAIEEVAVSRGIRAWKSESSGQQTLHSLLDKDQKGMQVWVATLLEATMDHIDGLKWGEIDESRKAPTPTETATVTATEPDLEAAVRASTRRKPEPTLDEAVAKPEPVFEIVEDVPASPLRDRYAEALLEVLVAWKETGEDLEPVLSRLDKLVGI